MRSLNVAIVIKRLKAHGFECIGSGYFSEVFAKPGSDRVIKVCRSHDRSLDFYIWSARHGFAGNIGPRVYSVRQYPDGTYVAVMERLKCTVSKVNRSHDWDAKTWVHAKAWAAVSQLTYGFDVANNAPIADAVWPGISEFIYKLRRDFGSLDAHDQNWMLREDGSLVCTDPVSFGRSSATKRLRSRDIEELKAAA